MLTKLVLGATATLIAARLGVRPFRVRVDGVSMSPTLVDGDTVYALGRWPPLFVRRDSLVVFRLEASGFESMTMIKRVDEVHRRSPANRWAPLTPIESLFVIADNPGLDSNIFGPVGYELVRGLVISKPKGQVRG